MSKGQPLVGPAHDNINSIFDGVPVPIVQYLRGVFDNTTDITVTWRGEEFTGKFFELPLQGSIETLKYGTPLIRMWLMVEDDFIRAQRSVIFNKVMGRFIKTTARNILKKPPLLNPKSNRYV